MSTYTSVTRNRRQAGPPPLVKWSTLGSGDPRPRAQATYMAADGAGAGRGGRAPRSPPLSALIVSAIAASSAVIVLAVVHSVQDYIQFRR